MPELPDIDVFSRYIDSTALYLVIEQVEISDERIIKDIEPADFMEKVKGKEFTSVRRHGKYLFVRLNSPDILMFHFGMTGFFDYSEDDSPPRHTRMELQFEDDMHLAFVCRRLLGKVGWTKNPRDYIRKHDLGPDALSDHWNLNNFGKLFEGSNATVKSALMKQQSISGIGNVYSDEMLYQARIAPGKKASELDKDEIRALHKSMLHVLKTAIDRQADPEQVPESWLLPRRKEGESCPSCEGNIEKTKISGRSSYFCPGCQK